MKKHSVEWIDHGREPQNAPNPKYPNGVDIKAVGPGFFCKVDLPYPARRCGMYIIRCSECGFNLALTTAGRRDDPRSVELNCRK